MKKISLFFTLVILIIIPIHNSCKESKSNICRGKNDKNVKYVSFVLSSIWEGDNYKLIIDDGKYTWESGVSIYTYFADYKRLKYIAEDYCTLSDSIKLDFYINNKDTTFYIPSKNIGLCFIGTDINRKLILKLYEKDSTYFDGPD